MKYLVYNTQQFNEAAQMVASLRAKKTEDVKEKMLEVMNDFMYRQEVHSVSTNGFLVLFQKEDDHLFVEFYVAPLSGEHQTTKEI